MKFLTIVIPCFNESDSLPSLINYLSSLNKEINFLIVENGSTDQSSFYLKENENRLNSNIEILYLNENKGYGHGVLTGLKSIEESKFIGWMHGDLQFEFAKLDNVYSELLVASNENNYIFYKGKRVGRNFVEKFFSFFMGILATIILRVKLSEINAQPTIFSQELLDNFSNPPEDFSFDTYVYWLAIKNNYKVIRKEFFFPPRKYGSSKWNFGLYSRIKFSNDLLKYFFNLNKNS